VWSPDGRKLAFTSNRNGNDDVYVVNSDGTGLTRLTTHTASDGSPTWSPDSQKIAFTSKRDGYSDVFVMNADGTNPVNLTRTVADEYDPIWSPVGNKIAFRSYRDGFTKLYMINADGTNQVRLTNSLVHESNASWSPDGLKLTFDSYSMSEVDWMEHYELWVVNTDGTGLLNLTPRNAAGDSMPAWSPDGKKLALASTRYGGSQYGVNYEMYTINPNGTGALRLTFEVQNHNGASWAPGSDRIVYISDPGGNYNNYEIFVINADGSNKVRLTTNTTQDYYPEWQPM
jgi:TolB protein